MSTDHLERQVAELTARVYRLELQVLASKRQAPAAAEAAVPIAPAATLTPPNLPPSEPFLARQEEAEEIAQRSAAAAALLPVAPQRPWQPAAALQPAAARVNAESIELKIGSKWMAWAGALLVVLAAGFFVKLAFDQGWLGRLSPTARCAILTLFGGALLASGEVALRRYGRAAAVSLYSAGLGTLFLTALAACKYFGLVSETNAFWLLAGVAALGVGVTVRSGSLTVGVLSLVAGYLAPALLSDAASFPAALPLYLTALLCVTLGLSAFGAEALRGLRYLALPMHALMATLWLAYWISHEGRGDWLLPLVFVSVWWMLLTGELLYAALRGRFAAGNANISLLATIWFAAVGCWLLYSDDPASAQRLAFFTACVAAITAIIAAVTGPGLTVLRTLPRRAMEKLAVSFWVQTGILVATAIGLYFDGPGVEGVGQTIGWLAMALGCVELGRRTSRGVTLFGLAVGALALGRFVLVDGSIPAVRATWWSLGDVTITYWGLLGLLAIGATILAALRVRIAPQKQFGAPGVLATIAVLLWMFVSLGQTAGLATTSAWLLGAALLLATQRWGRAQSFAPLAILLIGCAAVRWCVFDALATRTNAAWDAFAMPPVFNVQMLVAVAIMGGLAWVALAGRRRDAEGEPESPRSLAQATAQRTRNALCFAGIGVLLLVSLSFEIDRACERQAVWIGDVAMARQTCLSIFWGIYAIGLLALGFVRKLAPVRYAGLGLLAVTLAKVLLVDMAEVGYVYRVLSFLGLGVMLIFVSIAYARRQARLRAAEAVA